MLLMCMPYEGMTAAYADGLETAAGGITWAFIMYMVLNTTIILNKG